MLRLEPATEAVLPLLFDWIPDAKGALYWGGPDVRFPLTPETLTGMLREQGTLSFTAADEGGIVGFCQLRGYDAEAGTVRLARIIVSPSCRGEGVGRRMVKLLTAEAFSRYPVSKVELYVVADNEAAVRSYTDAGFRSEGLLRQPPPGFGSGISLLRMSCPREEA